MSIDPAIVELTANVYKIYIFESAIGWSLAGLFASSVLAIH